MHYTSLLKKYVNNTSQRCNCTYGIILYKLYTYRHTLYETVYMFYTVINKYIYIQNS